jgi:hypothetical protein
LATNDKNQLRLPVSFDMSDPRQKAAYDILKNAGYGKRTPIIVDALLDSLKTTAKENAAIQNSGNELSEDTIRRIVEESMEAVLNKHNFRHEDKTPSDPTPVKTDDPIQKFPVPPIPVPQPTQSYYPSQPAPTPAATDTGMNTLLSMADAFY